MALVLSAALTLPIVGHTVTELQDWEDAWFQRAAIILDQELMAEWRDMRARHQWYFNPREVASSSAQVVATPHPPSPGVEAWRALVARYFPADQVDRALRVMDCESGGNPWAYNPAFGATGLMQVLKSWADNFGYKPSDLFDPDINLYVASLLYYDGGWNHWNASKGCW